MKAVYRIIALFFLCFLVLGISNYSGASEIDNLRTKINERNSQIKEIEDQILEYQREIEEKSQEATTLKNQIAQLNVTLSKLSADIRLTEKRIDATELTIEELELKIIGKEKSIINDQASLAELIRELNDIESVSLVEMLLQNTKLSDFFDNIEHIQGLEQGIQANLAELKATKQILENEQEEKRIQKNTFLYLKEELGDRKDIENNTRNQKSYLLQITKNQETKYQNLLEISKKEREQLLQEIEQIENELRRLIDPSSLPKTGINILLYPIKDPIITQGFGLTGFAKNNSDIYSGGGHNGIDFRAAIGTPIYAAYEGIILKTGNTDLSCLGGSYGKWIIVEHPNNLATLYAHLSLLKVQSGQTIGRGQLLGYSGNTGYTTGPHLHFTVYAAGSAGEIRFGPSPSGRCDLLPYGGYLNPLDYL